MSDVIFLPNELPLYGIVCPLLWLILKVCYHLRELFITLISIFYLHGIDVLCCPVTDIVYVISSL